MTNNLYCLVMAGGQGTRLWPASRTTRPKQFLAFSEENSLIVETFKRFEGLVSSESCFVVSVESQRELLESHLSGIVNQRSGIIFEPAGRNTAPCILLSLASLVANGACLDDAIAIVPADHVIKKHQAFRQTMERASNLATNEDKIVTVGIRPHCPHTGYGYIYRGKKIADKCYISSGFREKPPLDLAQQYVDSGAYYWNAGMFVSTLGTLLNEFKNHAPEVHEYYEPLVNAIKNSDQNQVKILYQKIPANSIDYAVMEKSENVLVTEADFDWNDLGAWNAMEEVVELKEHNTFIGQKDDQKTLFQNATGHIISSEKKLVVLKNVEDLIIVENDDVLMVLPKKDAQRVKDIVRALKDNSDLNSFL